MPRTIKKINDGTAGDERSFEVSVERPIRERKKIHKLSVLKDKRSRLVTHQAKELKELDDFIVELEAIQ